MLEAHFSVTGYIYIYIYIIKGTKAVTGAVTFQKVHVCT